MATMIKCPSCSSEFPLEEALNDELKENIEREKQALRKQMLDYKKIKEEELQQKDDLFRQQARQQEQQFREQMETALKEQNQQMEENLRKKLSADYEHQLKMLQESAADNEEKLKEARKKKWLTCRWKKP